MKTELTSRQCAPCSGKTPQLDSAAIHRLRGQLGEGWNVADGRHLEKDYAFRDFKEALAFTNRVGAIAEEQGHHPDILLGWGKVKLTIWTHTIDGLSENDFILAARADAARQ
jgi:4a-hydroxytetrahydrobiopterin dehydratase